jgi:hypothetical protein
LPGPIPCGDIKVRQSLVVLFVIFHGIPQELSLEPVYRRPESVKKSIRESALFDMETFDTKIPRSEIMTASHFCYSQSLPSQYCGTSRRSSNGCTECELDVTCLRPSYFHEVTNEG